MATGAYMASAIEKRPNRYSPPTPCLRRQQLQMASMRAISSAILSETNRSTEALQFIGQSFFRMGNSEWISAQMERALARFLGLAGQPRPSSSCSEMYSQMARESHTVVSLCSSAGTFRDGE